MSSITQEQLNRFFEIMEASKLPSELTELSSITEDNLYAAVNTGSADALKVKPSVWRGSKGSYNAATNTPSLTNGIGVELDTYRVSVAGSRDFGAGSVSLKVGDIIMYVNGFYNKTNSTPVGFTSLQDVYDGSDPPEIQVADVSDGAFKISDSETNTNRDDIFVVEDLAGLVSMSVSRTGVSFGNSTKQGVTRSNLSVYSIAEVDALFSSLPSGLVPQGNWNANTNTPDITGTTETGYFWIVSVAGSTDLGGITDWEVNDWAVKTATGWAKVDNTEAQVLWGSINGTLSNQTDLQDALDLKANLSGGNTFDGDQIFSDLVFANSGFSTGTDAATSGAIRLENADTIVSRNAANSGNRTLMSLNASDVLELAAAVDATFGQDLTVATDKFHVDTTNARVGIGTNSPTRDLTVYSNSQPVVRVWNSSNVVFDMIANTTNGTIGTLSAHPLRILTNSAERIVLAADGSSIDMNGTVNIDPAQSSLDVGALDAGNIYLANNSGSSLAPTIASRVTGSIGFSFLAATADAGTVTGDMLFTVRENDNSDFSDLTQVAFKFDRFGTSLMEIGRNGNFDFKSGTATFGNQTDIEHDSETLLQLYRPNNTDNSEWGISFAAQNDNATPEKIIYADIKSQIQSNDDGSEDGTLKLSIAVNSGLVDRLNLKKDIIELKQNTDIVGTLAAGFGNDASGAWAVALNNSTTASGAQSFAANNSNLSDGSSSATFGNHNFARATSELAVGRFGTDYTATGTDTDRLFNIGNGSATNARSDAFTIFRNGDVRIDENIYTDGDTIVLQSGGLSGTSITLEDTTNIITFNTDAVIEGGLDVQGVVKTQGFTVATLPSGNQGDRAYVTDGASVSYGAAATGGGSTIAPVFYNNSQWIYA